MRLTPVIAVILCMAGMAVAQDARPAAQMPRQGTLKVGDLAPDFELTVRGGEQKVRLSSFRGRRPVALVFGSYT
jgi:hypothetical protein